jgi:hypothetical protein
VNNNIRFDLSDYLIHFFRDVDQESNNYILFPDHAGFNNLNHSTKLDALFLMRCALRNNKLCASWSYRNGKRTIYGRRPAICFTDMPLAAFLQTSKQRKSRGENIGQYALMLPKKSMFTMGARPVIYGLSSGSPLVTTSGEERVINTSQLPLSEQFRYVTYVPNSTRPIDWTHEREWRWPYDGDLSKFNSEIEEYGICNDFESYPGVNLSDIMFSGAGVVALSQDDAKKVLFDILTLVDRGILSKDAFGFIIQINKINSHTDILDPTKLSDYINDNLIDLSVYFNVDSGRARSIRKDIDIIINEEIAKASSISENEGVLFGKSWVWVVDNQTELTRALISLGELNVNKEGRYLLNIDGISHFYLEKQEYICKNIAKRISATQGQTVSYFSVMGKTDYDEVPFYTDFIDEDHEFYSATISVD